MDKKADDSSNTFPGKEQPGEATGKTTTTNRIIELLGEAVDRQETITAEATDAAGKAEMLAHQKKEVDARVRRLKKELDQSLRTRRSPRPKSPTKAKG